MSKMLSGVVGSESRIKSECGGKMPLANEQNCTDLRDIRPSTTKNRMFLTLAIPGNLARLSARRVPLPINSERLHAPGALCEKKRHSRFSERVCHPDWCDLSDASASVGSARLGPQRNVEGYA